MLTLIAVYINTVVLVMNGHPRDQAKVSLHDRWAAPNVIGLPLGLHDYIYVPAIFILYTTRCAFSRSRETI